MQLEITNHMYKTRLDLSGKVIRGDKKKRVERNPARQALPAVKQAELPPGYCGSCYGAAPEVRDSTCRRGSIPLVSPVLSLYALFVFSACTGWCGARSRVSFVPTH